METRFQIIITFTIPFALTTRYDTRQFANSFKNSIVLDRKTDYLLFGR